MHSLYLMLLISGVICLQDFKLNLNKKPESGDEKRYPNGTVVGKYTYVDDGGNPIEVKYYADDAGYGVELKSVKVVDGNPEMTSIQADKLEYLTKTDEPHFKPVSDFLNVNYPIGVKDDPLGYLNKANSKVSHPKQNKDNSDYEVYYKNEFRGPKKWSNDKVRVYFDKDKRKARNSFKKINSYNKVVNYEQ